MISRYRVEVQDAILERVVGHTRQEASREDDMMLKIDEPARRRLNVRRHIPASVRATGRT
jgi:hypothetical protein